MLIIGPTEDGRPSTAYAPAARYAKELRDAGTDIYVVNPGYRINEDEGRTIASNIANVKYKYYRGLNSVQGPMIKGIFGGRCNDTRTVSWSITSLLSWPFPFISFSVIIVIFSCQSIETSGIISK